MLIIGKEWFMGIKKLLSNKDNQVVDKLGRLGLGKVGRLESRIKAGYRDTMMIKL